MGVSNNVQSIIPVSSAETIHPVECLVAWKFIEDICGSLPDQRLEVREIAWGNDRTDDFALRRMLRRVHANEIGRLLS